MNEPRHLDPRDVLALERTFLAWIRTGMSFVGLGLVLSKFLLVLREAGLAGQHPGTHTLGVALVAAGGVITVVAAIWHVLNLKALSQGRFIHHTWLALLVAAMVALAAMYALVVVV